MEDARGFSQESVGDGFRAEQEPATLSISSLFINQQGQRCSPEVHEGLGWRYARELQGLGRAGGGGSDQGRAPQLVVVGLPTSGSPTQDGSAKTEYEMLN